MNLSRYINLAIILTGIFFSVMLYDTFFRDSVVVEPFSVPEDFAKRGLTGAALANRLIDSINRSRPTPVADTSCCDGFSQTLVASIFHFPQPTSTRAPDFEIPSTGVSLQALARYVGHVFGTTKHTVSGEVVAFGDEIRLTVRIGSDYLKTFVAHHTDGRLVGADGDTERSPATATLADHRGRSAALGRHPHPSRQASHASVLEALDSLIGQAAIEVYKNMQPLVWLDWQCQEPVATCQSSLQSQVWSPMQQIEAYYLVGLNMSRQTHYADADRLFKMAMETDVKPAAAWWNARHKTARDRDRLHHLRAEACIGRAVALKDQGRLADALALFAENGCSTPPRQYARAYTKWAELLLMADRVDEAIEKATQGASLDASLPLAHYMLGRALFERNQHQLAKESFRRAVEANDRFAWAYAWMARCEYALGNDEAAEEMARRYQGFVNADSVDARHVQGLVLARKGQRSEAIAELQKALGAGPARAEIYFDLGMLYMQGGEVQMGRAYFAAFIGLGLAEEHRKASTARKIEAARRFMDGGRV